jgi:type IV conjugative transfer system protein TraL
MKKWIPKYLTSSAQFLFWEQEEFLPILLGFVLAVLYHCLYPIAAGFALSFVIGGYKKKAPKGFLSHLFYIMGVTDMQGFPVGLSRRFLE